MSRWFRYYDDAVNDPKIIKLSDEMFRAWVNILCVASRHDGKLPDVEDIAITLRVKEARAQAILSALCGAGLLDHEEGCYTPHNWSGRQYKSDVSNDRVQRYRDRKRNATCNVTETPSETLHATDVTASVTQTVTPSETETETETEQNRTDAPSALGAASPRAPAKKPPAQRKVARATTAVPENYAIPLKVETYGKTLGLTGLEIAKEHTRFCNWALQGGKRYVDWEAAERNWLMGTADKLGRVPPQPQGTVSAMFHAKDGSPEMAAWNEFRSKNGQPPAARDRNFGWHFPQQWPPGHPNNSDRDAA